MTKQPFFSVIIPTYNRGPFLEKAVLSVLNQTYTDLELIVVDDGSTDGTEKLISSITDTRLKYLKQQNYGVSRARNRGLEISRGNLAAFLDSDDLWKPEKLRVTAEYIKLFPNINIFHTEETWFRRGEALCQKKKHTKPSGWVYQNALPICCIGMSTSVVKRKVFDEIGVFDETLEACEDYDLWLRATNVFEVKLIPEALTVKHGGRPDQLSVKVWGLDRFRIKALAKMLESGELNQENYSATFSVIKKKCEVFAAGCEKRSKITEAEHYRKLPLSFPPEL